MVNFLETKADFDSFLDENHAILVVIDFTASWCGPCKRIAPFFKTLSEKYSNVAFAKVDVDENQETAESCGVSAMPTFILYKNKAKVASVTGANEAKLEELVVTHK